MEFADCTALLADADSRYIIENFMLHADRPREVHARCINEKFMRLFRRPREVHARCVRQEDVVRALLQFIYFGSLPAEIDHDSLRRLMLHADRLC